MDLRTFKASQTYPGYPLPGEVNYAKLLPSVNHALLFADCTTVRRAAGWSAQMGAESGSFRWMAELADGSAYEWRADLGNVRAGDGRRFKGGGPIQLTGRHNYTVFSKWAWKNRKTIKRDFGLTITSKTMFVDRPKLVQTRDDYGLLAADWYWTKARNMNSYCDRNDIVGMTRAVNGGLNNLSGRTQRYRKAKSLGIAMLPTAPPTRPKPTPTPPVAAPPKHAKPVATIPAKTRPATPKPAKTPSKRRAAKYENYRVQPGDTLAKIAAHISKRNGRHVTWQQLRKVNRLKSANVIYVGDVLHVPARKKAAR